MKKLNSILAILLIVVFAFPCQSKNTNPSEQDQQKDMEMIFAAIERYNQAWRTRDVNLAIQDYSSNFHWVNSVGDVKMTKKALEEYLTFVFKLDQVMDSERIPQSDQITYMSSEIAIVNSMHIESGSKNFHLRVFSKQGDSWKIINHITSREHPKG